MSTYQQLHYRSHEGQSSRDDRRTLSRGRPHSTSDSSAKLLSTSTHPRSKVSRSQTCRIPVRHKQTMALDTADNAVFAGYNENGPPSTPVSVPSLSGSKDISPQSSRRRSPITPTFIDNRTEENAPSNSSPLKSHSLKPSRELEKKNISYPMSNPAYSTIPLTLDIRVDRDAYEPRREPPRPIDPLPRDLETSYLEWDETPSKLDKMKKSMRSVGHGLRKQAIPITLDVLPYRSPDKCINATPRTSPSSRSMATTADRHHHQEQSSHVSNFSRPTFQVSPSMEGWSKHTESDRNQAAVFQMCDWQELSRSSMPSQQMRHPKESSPTVRLTKNKHTDHTLCSQHSASVSRQINSRPPSMTAKTDVGSKIAAQQPSAKPNTGTRSFAAHDRDPYPQAPLFYTYHVTRRIDATNTTASSYTYPRSSGSLPVSPFGQTSIDVSQPSSRYTDDEIGPTKNRRFKNIVQGMTKKPSLSNLRRRGTHSGARR